MYEVSIPSMWCTPRYNNNRSPIAPSRGGISKSNAGIMGTTMSVPYAVSAGGVTNGSVNSWAMFSMPR